MPPKRPAISDTELEVLKALWSGGPGTVRDVEDRLERKRPWAYNTLLTLLSRLRAKGYVTTDRRETAHVFKANVTREQLLSQSLLKLVDRVCDGTATPLVQALVRQGRLSARDLARLRQMLDELDPEPRG